MQRILLLAVPLVLGGCGSAGVEKGAAGPVAVASLFGQLVAVQAEPGEGFNYPYFLYVPEQVALDRSVRLLVEPNNTGWTDDDFQIHLDRARDQVQEGRTGRRLADELGSPLLVPAFPRPRDIWRTYTHALDRDALLIDKGALERIDLQLAAMIEHTRVYLTGQGLAVKERVFMNGFSASGNFVNRFAALQPRLVRAVATGAVNGLPIFPRAELAGEELPYPIGIADIGRLTGSPFNETDYDRISQYIYMGYLDRNDTFPFDDAWDDGERALIARLFGRQMMPNRWERSQELLAEWAPSAQLVTYDGTGHRIKGEMLGDLVAFFRANDDDGYNPIEPHRYPFVEFAEITQAHISSLHWLGDEAIPEWARAADQPGAIAIRIEEWMEGQDYQQLDTFYGRAGLHFLLRAAGQEDIAIDRGNYKGNQSDGNGSYQAFIVVLQAVQLAAMAPGVSYELLAQNSSDEFFWTVRPGVELVKP
ncbi:MAG: hypothetical protein GKR89_07150 [Candidatus Latescibacteria bacterium]|nr:hypothetical protein [Candidatus Latescibacterota bacterium]